LIHRASNFNKIPVAASASGFILCPVADPAAGDEVFFPELSMPDESISFEEPTLEPSVEPNPQEMRARRAGAGARRSQLEKAGDCRTEPGWLARAARSVDPDILKAVARNPNTPKRNLFRL
jgi:hypothetical protein